MIGSEMNRSFSESMTSRGDPLIQLPSMTQVEVEFFILLYFGLFLRFLRAIHLLLQQISPLVRSLPPYLTLLIGLLKNRYTLPSPSHSSSQPSLVEGWI